MSQWLQGSANTLQQLLISECENLKALPEWLPRLKSLHKLSIDECPKLSSLPEGMEVLTALRELKISGSPDFIRKCREEDWHKIAHVPDIELEEDGGSSSSPSEEEVRVDLSSCSSFLC